MSQDTRFRVICLYFEAFDFNVRVNFLLCSEERSEVRNGRLYDVVEISSGD